MKFFLYNMYIQLHSKENIQRQWFYHSMFIEILHVAIWNNILASIFSAAKISNFFFTKYCWHLVDGHWCKKKIQNQFQISRNEFNDDDARQLGLITLPICIFDLPYTRSPRLTYSPNCAFLAIMRGFFNGWQILEIAWLIL